MLGEREQTWSLVSLNKGGKRIKGVQKKTVEGRKNWRERRWNRKREIQKGEENRETPEEEEGKKKGDKSSSQVGEYSKSRGGRILGTQELGKKNWNREKRTLTG